VYSNFLAAAVRSTRVYVGNLPWNVSWQNLKDHFRSAGNVVHASVFSDESGRSKGCGIVEYSTKEEADKAIKTLNDTTIGDSERLIFVREDREDKNTRDFPPVKEYTNYSPKPKEKSEGRQVFVGNLSFHTSWQDLKDAFRHCGKIVRADILTLPNGRSKGAGIILFETREEAQNAIALMNNVELAGRKMFVHEDKFA